MDSIIPLRQKNTLAEYMILSGADNRPPMLDKDLYDSWKSQMEIYMKNREHGRMILESIENGPLIWPTIEENESFQRFMEESSITDARLSPEWSKFVTDVKLVKDLHTTNFDQLHAYLEQHELHANEVRLLRYDPIACLNKAMAFLTTVASSRVTVQQVQGRQGQSYSGTGYKSNATSSGRNNECGHERIVKCYNCLAQEAGQILDEEQLAFLADPGVPDGQAVQTIIPENASFQTEDLDTYDSDCDDISNAKVVLMANISNYGSDVILEVPHSETYLNDMENQGMFKLYLVPLAPKLLQNREAHIDYLKDTCPNAINLSAKRLLSDPKTMSRKLGLKCSTSNCRSNPTGNKKNDRILQTQSRNMKKKVEARPRKVNKKNHVVERIRNVDVKQSQLNANSKLICATCKKSMFDGVHDMCLLDFVKNVNSRAKSAKKHKKQNIWKPRVMYSLK
nr:hypothetical protein [Tanacetum cinerariifolium]